MKLRIYKYIYDTDNGTGCDLYLQRTEALERLFEGATAAGYVGAADEEAIMNWRSDEYAGIDTFYVDHEDIEIPYPAYIRRLLDNTLRGLENVHNVLENKSSAEGLSADAISTLPEMSELSRVRNSIASAVAQISEEPDTSIQQHYVVVGRRPEGENSIWTGFAADQDEYEMTPQAAAQFIRNTANVLLHQVKPPRVSDKVLRRSLT